MTTTPSPSTEARPLAAGRVLVVLLIALMGGALLNADAILRTAERQELGTGRSVALAFAEPLADVSGFLRLTAARDAADEALGRNQPRRDVTVADSTTTTTTTTTPPDDPAAAATTTTTSTTLPPLRTVSEAIGLPTSVRSCRRVNRRRWL